MLYLYTIFAIFFSVDEVSDTRTTISYVLINPSYDLKLELGDIVYVSSYFSFNIGFYENILDIWFTCEPNEQNTFFFNIIDHWLLISVNKTKILARLITNQIPF